MLLSEIAIRLKGRLVGNGDLEISNVADFNLATAKDLTFLFEKKLIAKKEQSKALAFVTSEEIPDLSNQIIVKNPRKALALAISIFYKKDKPLYQISDKADIASSAILHKEVSCASYVTIGDNTSINQGTIIHSNVSIGKNCKIGKNCIIYSNVVLYNDIEIGDNVIIHSGSVIGADGFGFYPDGKNWRKIPQIAGVIIADQVEIGANTTIDRGCLKPTKIDSGTKIDNLVHIAHNCELGKNCMITAFVGFSGGVILEDHVIIAGQAGLNNQVKVGENAIILAKAGVTKDILPNQIVAGYPAQPNQQELAEKAILKKIVKKYKK